jgi:hypothetical protein
MYLSNTFVNTYTSGNNNSKMNKLMINEDSKGNSLKCTDAVASAKQSNIIDSNATHMQQQQAFINASQTLSRRFSFNENLNSNANNSNNKNCLNTNINVNNHKNSNSHTKGGMGSFSFNMNGDGEATEHKEALALFINNKSNNNNRSPASNLSAYSSAIYSNKENKESDCLNELSSVDEMSKEHKFSASMSSSTSSSSTCSSSSALLGRDSASDSTANEAGRHISTNEIVDKAMPIASSLGYENDEFADSSSSSSAIYSSNLSQTNHSSPTMSDPNKFSTIQQQQSIRISSKPTPLCSTASPQSMLISTRLGSIPSSTVTLNRRIASFRKQRDNNVMISELLSSGGCPHGFKPVPPNRTSSLQYRLPKSQTASSGSPTSNKLSSGKRGSGSNSRLIKINFFFHLFYLIGF